MISWCPRGLTPAQRAHQRILDGLACNLVHQVQYVADRPATCLGQTPGRETLRYGVDVFDAPFGIRADVRIADGLERHLRPLLLRKYGLFSALALSDVSNRALVTGDAVACVPHGACILENHNLLPILGPHAELCVADLPFGLHTSHELRPVCRVPVKQGNAWQCIEFLSAAVAQDGHERWIHR